ncbi:hypothetical protein AAFF_G00282140 [Aldrovandia affinis]|uniref:Uncharacterized protein n=1 Tax=Aldrovandia affinis TaxID=143900 RepID=A0AAD7RAE3_9TELE|nr:hypothetical protein AAFF_G00282140 [Aldrovandia affinis]
MVQKLLRLDWGRPLGSQPLPRSLTLLLVPPRARWWDLNTIDIVLWLQDIARQTLWRAVQAVTHVRDEGEVWSLFHLGVHRNTWSNPRIAPGLQTGLGICEEGARAKTQNAYRAEPSATWGLKHRNGPEKPCDCGPRERTLKVL